MQSGLRFQGELLETKKCVVKFTQKNQGRKRSQSSTIVLHRHHGILEAVVLVVGPTVQWTRLGQLDFYSTQYLQWLPDGRKADRQKGKL